MLFSTIFFLFFNDHSRVIIAEIRHRWCLSPSIHVESGSFSSDTFRSFSGKSILGSGKRRCVWMHSLKRNAYIISISKRDWNHSCGSRFKFHHQWIAVLDLFSQIESLILGCHVPSAGHMLIEEVELWNFRWWDSTGFSADACSTRSRHSSRIGGGGSPLSAIQTRNCQHMIW